MGVGHTSSGAAGRAAPERPPATTRKITEWISTRNTRHGRRISPTPPCAGPCSPTSWEPSYWPRPSISCRASSA